MNTRNLLVTKDNDVSAQKSVEKSRRNFLISSAAVGLLASARPVGVWGAPSVKSPAESMIAELYYSLSSDQKLSVARSWSDPLRSRVNANWHVTKPLIGADFYSPKQRSMVQEIVKNLTSEAGYERLKKQTDDDDGGIEAYSMAWFGTPGDSQFEWMLTGRHLTLRADGNTQDRIAFGGPVVYGHGNEDSPKNNLFYYQTEKVQRVFESLSSDQRSQALTKAKAPAEASVPIQGSGGKFSGISGKSLNSEQRGLLLDAVTTILSMYREEDSSEAIEIINGQGGIESLHVAYYAAADLLNDGIWDVWRIEGPSAVIHFRGAPHVHAYIHVKSAAV